LNNSEKASIAALLGRCFISEMDRETIDLMLNESILEALEKISPGFTGYMNESSWNDLRLEQLASEYCHLFILPGKKHISLRMSHWVKDNAFDTTVLENIISEMDFDFESLKISKTPTDHLGVLLYFMGGVYSSEDKEVSCLASDLEKQLFFWITAFESKLTNLSKSPFYPTCARLLIEILSADS
jgi:TorA maturation chaperone TorD